MQRENKWQDRFEELTNEYNIFIERVIVENPFEDTEELTDEHRTIIKASLNFWLLKLDRAVAEEVENILSKIQEDVDFGAKHQQLVQTKAQAYCLTLLTKLK
jgi:hypothetical protein